MALVKGAEFLNVRRTHWNEQFEELLENQNAYLRKETIAGHEITAERLILIQMQMLDDLKADLEDVLVEFENYIQETNYLRDKKSLEEVTQEMNTFMEEHYEET